MNEAERRVGTTLNGKYRIEQLLGVGGMAVVYRARHRNGNRVAVKVLHTGLSIHTDLRDRFLREGYVANKVDHRGAVRVLDDDTAEDGSVFLVMELLEGETLNTLLFSFFEQLGAHVQVVPSDRHARVVPDGHPPASAQDPSRTAIPTHAHARATAARTREGRPSGKLVPTGMGRPECSAATSPMARAFLRV